MPEPKAVKDLPILTFIKGRRLGELWVKSAAKPSLLGRITSTLGEHNILIKNIVAYTSGNEGHAFIFFDYTEASAPLSEVVEKLKSIPDVTEVGFYSPGKPEYIAEVFGFPSTTSRDRDVMVIRVSSFAEMIQGIKRSFGSAGDAFLWYLAKEIGSSTAAWIKEELKELSVAEKIEFHLTSLFSAGWGIFELKRLEGGVVEVQGRETLESRFSKGKSREPSCTFTRGYLAGILSTMTGMSVKVEEVSCQAKGDSACTFMCRLG